MPVRELRGDGERPGDGLIAIKQQGQPRAAAGEGAARRQRVGRRGEALERGRVERQDHHVVPELARRDSDGEARGRRRVDDERAGRCRRPRRKLGRPRHGRVDCGGAARRTVEYAAFLGRCPRPRVSAPQTYLQNSAARRAASAPRPRPGLLRRGTARRTLLCLRSAFLAMACGGSGSGDISTIEAARPRRPRKISGPPKNARPST